MTYPLTPGGGEAAKVFTALPLKFLQGTSVHENACPLPSVQAHHVRPGVQAAGVSFWHSVPLPSFILALSHSQTLTLCKLC